MSVWRRRALEAFPELRDELNNVHEIPSIYELWFRVLEMTGAAYRDDDEATLSRTYAFTLWCFEQRSEELWNSVAVAFFELLPETVGRQHLGDALRRIPDHVVRDLWSLWESSSLVDDMRAELRSQRRPIPT